MLCTVHILNGITPRSTLEVGSPGRWINSHARSETWPLPLFSYHTSFFPAPCPRCYFFNDKHLLNEALLTWSSRAVDARSLVPLPLMPPTQQSLWQCPVLKRTPRWRWSTTSSSTSTPSATSALGRAWISGCTEP